MISPSKPKAPRRGLFFLLVTGISIVLYFASAFTTLKLMHRVTITVVPDLMNKSVESARSMLRVKRLDMEIAEYRFDQRVEANKIIGQNPLAGETSESGKVIKVVVSRGARTLTIPTLSGLSITQAAARLEKEGFNIGRVTRLYTTDASKEMILDQYPETGTHAARGTNIHLLVSQGPRPQWFIMPKFEGWTVDDAAQVLNQLGMELREIKRQVDDEHPNGTVLNQTPQPGLRIKTGVPAGLVVSVSSSLPDQETRFERIEFTVPATSMEVRLKFMLRDESGLHEVYNAMEKPNTKISIGRVITGTTAQLYIYINGKLHEERTLGEQHAD